MLSDQSLAKSPFKLWHKITSFTFVVSLLATMAPIQSASAKAAQSAAAATAAAADLTPVADAAQVIGAFVPFLPMESGGTAFARIFALNLGSSPTQKGSTTSLTVSGLPAGVEIKSVLPEPTQKSNGWKCAVNVCSWVNTSGAGAQIPVGETIEGLVTLSISADAQVASITDAQIKEMVDASVNVKDQNDPRRKRMQEIADGLTPLKVGISFEGDTTSTSQETSSYLGVSDASNRARVAAVLSGKSTASIGDDASWTVRLVNLGGAASGSEIKVNNLLPSDIGLSEVTAQGQNWNCSDSSSKVSDCTYAGALAPGSMSEPLTIHSTVRDDATIGKEQKWQVSVDGMPAFIPADGVFTASEAVAPDLGLQMIAGSQVIVPGGLLNLHVQAGTYAGGTRKPVILDITGLPGAKVDDIIAATGENSSGFRSTDSSGNAIGGAVLSKCISKEDGVQCVVRRMKKGELYAAVLSLRIPANFTAKDQSAVVRATVLTENEAQDKTTNNSVGLPLVVQPANAPYPTLFAAHKDASGIWSEFNGETVKLKSDSPAEFGYVVKNTGAKAFAAGTVMSFNLMLQDGVTAQVKGDWSCIEQKFPAPEFSEEQRLGAATAARTAGIGFDLDRPASKLEEQLISQIKEQATVTPIENVSGEVPGLSCTTKLKKPVAVGEATSPAVFTASVSDDADVSVALWRAELTAPQIKKVSRVDISAVTTAAKRGIAPVLVADPVRSGSVSNFKVSVVNKGELATEHPAVVLSIPAGLRLNQTLDLPKGWNCVLLAQGLIGGLAVCTSKKLAGSEESSVAEFQLQANTSRKKASKISAVALTNSPKIGLAATSESTVDVKAPLTVKVMGPETVNDVSVPLGGGEPAATRVSVTAQSSADGVVYRWKQLCTAKGEKGCFSIAPRVKWVKRTGQSGEFVVPRVDTPIDLVIQVTANDNDAAASSSTMIRLLPRPKVQAPPTAAGQSLRMPSADGEGDATTADEANTENSPSDTKDPLVPTVAKYVPSSLAAVPSAGSQTNASRNFVVRPLTGVSLRANVFGSNVVAVERGKKVSALAAISGASGATWAWSFINGPTDLRDNAEFQAAITATTKASLSLTVPELAEGVSSSNNNVTLKVTVSVGGKTISDVLSIRIVADESSAKDVVETEQAIAIDGVNRDNPVLLSPSSSAAIGAAVAEGNTVVWSVEGESATISNDSATGVKVTATSIRGTSVVTAEVRDADGNSLDILSFPVVVSSEAAFPQFCEQLTSGIKEASSSLAGFNIDSELGSAPDCEFNQAIEFTDKSLGLGIASFTGLSGTIARDGIFISAGTVSTQVDLPVNELVVKNLFIPFRQGNQLGSISGFITGSLSSSVTSALHIENWKIGATLRISNGELKYVVVNGEKSTTSAVVSSDSTDASDTTAVPETTVSAESSDSKTEATDDKSTFSASGTVGSDGSLLLEASVKNLELFNTVTVNAEGSINIPATGREEFSLKASLAKAVSLTDGVELSEATLDLETDKVSGTGKVSVNRDGLTFDVSTSIELSDEKQEFTFNTNVPTLEPVTGFALKNVEINGTVAHIAEGFAGDIKATAENISFASGYVVVTEPTINLGFDCTDGAYADKNEAAATTIADGNEKSDAEAEKTKDKSGCDASFGLTAGIEVGVTDPVKGSLTSTIDTAKKTATFEGSLKNVDFGSGVVLNELNLEVKYEDGEVSFNGNGDLTILDTNVTATVIATKKNMVLRAGLSDLQPFGSDQISLASGEVIIVAKYEEGKEYTWTPKNDELAEYVGDQKLVSGDIRIAAIVDMPSDFENVKSLTNDRFTLPTKASVKGEYNFETGKANLAVETADGSLTLTGAFAREAKGKKWSYDINVNVPDAITIVDGLTLKSFALRVTNLNDKEEIDSLNISGKGAIAVDVAGLNAEVNASIDFKSKTEWELKVDGTVPTFDAIPGFELNDLEFGGSLTKKDKKFTGSLNLKAADLTFASGMVKLVDPTLTLEVACGTSLSTTTVQDEEAAVTTVAEPEAEAKPSTENSEAVDEDAKGCALSVDASMDIEVSTNGNTYTGSMSGSINTEEESANFTAKLGDIELTDDVTLTDVQVEFDATKEDFSFVIDGSLTIFGSKVSGRVTLGADTAVLQASVAGLAPFGDGGPSIKAGEVVLVLMSPDAGWKWKPIEDDLNVVVSEFTVAKKDIRLAVIVGLPDSFDNVETLTRGVITLPKEIVITGSFNFGNGAISLAASATSTNFNISGALSRANKDAKWLWDVSLKTNREINLIPGFDRLSLTNLTFNITNKDENGEVGSVVVNLDGALKLTISNTSVLTVGATVRFAGTDDWDLKVTGAIAGQDGGTWEIIPGLRLPATQITGTVSKISGEFSANLRIDQTSPWRPINAVTIKDMFIEIGVKRTAGSGWDFNFLLGGKLKVSIGSLVLPEMAITGGYQGGIWFLQVEVGDEVCHDVPVSQSANNASPTTASTATTAGGATQTQAATTTVANSATTTVPRDSNGAAGQSLVLLSPSHSPPAKATKNVNANSDATTTTVAPSASDTQTQNVCERVINVASGLEIINATFRLQYDTNVSELSIAINGGLRILGFQIDAQVKLSNNGLFMVAGVKNWELFDGGPTFSEMAVIFSTYGTSYTLASGYKASVPGMDVTLIAQMAMPEGIKKTVGDVQLEPLKISLRGLLTGNIDLKIGIVLPPEAWIFKAGGYGVRLASVGLQLSIRNFADLTVGIYGEARMLVPNQVDQVPARIAISFSSTGTLSINMSIGLDADGNSVPWQNVFGIDGLTINFAAFSFGINFSSTPIPTPEIGMAVSFQLPRALRNLVGMEDGINIEGAFFFSTTRGVCLVVSVGQEPKVGDTARTLPKAIDLFSHNLVGNYLGIKFAPIGCKIAEKSYDPGISVGFSAAIMGVSFTALAKIDIKKLEMQVYANFDSFSIGALKMKQTYLDLLVSGTSPLDSHVIFSGGFDLALPGGTATVSLQVAAKLGTEPIFAIDGRIDSLSVVPGILDIRKVRIQGLLKPTELRLFVNLEGDVSLLGSTVKGSFRLDVDSTGVREVSARLDADIKLAGDAVGVKGNFDFTYLKGGFPKLNFAGTLNVGGRSLAAAEGSFDQYAFSVKARLDLGRVFNGQVEGKIVFCNPDGAIKIQNQAGQMVTGAGGDFFFAASANVDLGLTAANGTVKFGRAPNEDRVVSQKCPVMAPTVSSANADQIMSDAMGSALRCAPGLQTTTSVPRTTVPGQTTTTVAPCPSTTTSIATSTTVRAAGQSLRFTGQSDVTPTPTPTTIASTNTTVAPTTTSTTVPALPLAPRTTWGDIALEGALNLGPLQGNMRLGGSFDAAGNVNLAVNGRLTVAPLANTTLSGSFVRTTNGSYTALLTFDASVANVASVRFQGHIQNGEYEFLGTGSLNLGSIVQSNGVFHLSNIPGREGLKAEVNFFAGNDATASVRGSGIMVFSGNWWDAEFGASFRTPIGSVGAGVYIGNMRVQRHEVRVTRWELRKIRVGFVSFDTWMPVHELVPVPCQEDGYPGGTIVIAGQSFCTLNENRLDVRANVSVYNQNFGLGATITSNSFVAVAAAPWWYDQGAANRGEEWPLNYLGSYNVFWFPFRTVSLQIWWGGRLTIQAGVPNQPSISFQGTGKLRFNWYWSVTCLASLRGQFNPTYLGAGVDCGLGALWVGFG